MTNPPNEYNQLEFTPQQLTDFLHSIADDLIQTDAIKSTVKTHNPLLLLHTVQEACLTELFKEKPCWDLMLQHYQVLWFCLRFHGLHEFGAESLQQQHEKETEQ